MFFIDDGRHGCPTEDFLVMMVRENTGDRSWDADPRTSITLLNGFLYVSQTAEVHRQIEPLVARLRF